MSQSSLRNLFALAILALGTTGCEAIASIFRAGMWVGILIVVLVLALVGLVIGRARR
jgi:hypothetical protein